MPKCGQPFSTFSRSWHLMRKGNAVYLTLFDSIDRFPGFLRFDAAFATGSSEGVVVDSIRLEFGMSADETHTQDTAAAGVRRGLDLFIAVIKKHAFYPEGNDALQQSFQGFYEWLAAFLRNNESLRIDVERTQLVYQGEVVQQEQSGERSVIFPLFRDGIQWFEFQDGVTADELWGFIRLVNQYREYRDESENDLVTALWEADFPCIRHKAVDKFWEAETVIDISTLKINGGPDAADVFQDPSPQSDAEFEVNWGEPVPDGQILVQADGMADAMPDGDDSMAVPDHDFGPASKSEEIANPMVRMLMSNLEQAQSHGSDVENIGQFWKLTPEEEGVLRELIAVEERRNTTRDCLNILLVLLRETLDGPDKILVREFVAEEIRHLLSEGDFSYARAFVEQLTLMKEADRSDTSRLADEIIAKIAGVGVLGALNQVWPRTRTIPNAILDDLRRMLLLLPSAAIDSLAPMVARTGDPRTKAILMDAVAFHVVRSRADVTHVVSAMPSGLICELIGCYAALGQTPPVDMLAKLTRHRDSPVRETAARALVAEGSEHLKTVFHLLGDPDPNVVRWLLGHMARERNPAAERLLLDHLAEKSRQNGVKDEKLLFDCYQALGGCASKQSVPFLRDILMQKSWRAFFGMEHSAHRIGAAIALSQMPAEWGAGEALREAESSRFAGIRRAQAQARAATRKRRRDANE